MVQQLQAVINTLQELDIKTTYSNLDKLLGCIQVLDRIKNDLQEKQSKPAEPDITVDPSEDPVIEIAGGQN